MCVSEAVQHWRRAGALARSLQPQHHNNITANGSRVRDLRSGELGARATLQAASAPRGFGWISHTAEPGPETHTAAAAALAHSRRQQFSHCHFAACALHGVVLNRRRLFSREMPLGVSTKSHSNFPRDFFYLLLMPY